MSPEHALGILVGAAILTALVFVVLPARADRRKRQRRLKINERRSRDPWHNPTDPDERLTLIARRKRRSSEDDGGSGSDSGGGGDGGGGGD